MTTPRDIKAKDGFVDILWSDGHQSHYAGRDLRLACRCAACVDEWTHEKIIVADHVPPVVKPAAIQVVGNYALQFNWSDGHSTGIYTYDYLRELCSCSACRAPREFMV